MTSWKELKDWRENFRLRERQEKILAKLNHFFPIADQHDLKQTPDFYQAFLELTDTSLRNFELFTRVIAISTNSEYLDLIRENNDVAYYQFSSEEFPAKWYYQSTYWSYKIVEKVAQSFRHVYDVFIPGLFYPLVLSTEEIYVVIAPRGTKDDYHYSLDKALPDVRTGMERYDAQVQKDIQAGYKWKLEFEKNNLKGLRQLFGFYTQRKRCFAMGDIIAEGGNFVYISKVLAKEDIQFKESRLND